MMHADSGHLLWGKAVIRVAQKHKCPWVEQNEEEGEETSYVFCAVLVSQSHYRHYHKNTSPNFES